MKTFAPIKTKKLVSDYNKPYYNFASTGYITSSLDKITSSQMSGEKIDIDKFFKFVKANFPYKKSEKEFNFRLRELAVDLGFVERLKLKSDEKKNLKMAQEFVHGAISMEDFDNAEIESDESFEYLPTDYIVRTMDNTIPFAAYRFPRKLSEHESNLMKGAFAYKYGNEDVSFWEDYLSVRPITYKRLVSDNKNFNWTRNPEEFHGEVYN